MDCCGAGCSCSYRVRTDDAVGSMEFFSEVSISEARRPSGILSRSSWLPGKSHMIPGAARQFRATLGSPNSLSRPRHSVFRFSECWGESWLTLRKVANCLTNCRLVYMLLGNNLFLKTRPCCIDQQASAISSGNAAVAISMLPRMLT